MTRSVTFFLGRLLLTALSSPICLRRRRKRLLSSLTLQSSSLSWFGSRLPVLRFIAVNCHCNDRFYPPPKKLTGDLTSALCYVVFSRLLLTLMFNVLYRKSLISLGLMGKRINRTWVKSLFHNIVDVGSAISSKNPSFRKLHWQFPTHFGNDVPLGLLTSTVYEMTLTKTTFEKSTRKKNDTSHFLNIIVGCHCPYVTENSNFTSHKLQKTQHTGSAFCIKRKQFEWSTSRY
jgi:hypothetical protein